MSKEIEILSEILGEYQDLEQSVYQIFLQTIQTKGILIQSPKLDSILLNKINPTWADLLNEHCSIIYDSWNLGPRTSVKKPLLADSETYELSLLCPNKNIPLGQKPLKEWRQRITQAGVASKNNFISALAPKYLDFIKSNPFVLQIKLVTLDLKARTEAENRLYLNAQPQAYLHHLLDKALSDYQLILKGERAKLFGAPKFKDMNKTRDYLLNQHFNGFGLKDILHIRYVLENLKDKLLTNDDLINEVPASVLLQQENLLYLKTCLLLGIPFSGR
jgi:hypothetical protein